jgi:hypothetical protein
MSDAPTVSEALAQVKPKPKPRSQKRATIEENLGAIYAKRDEGCTWAEIAEGLGKAGIVMSPAALRFAVNAKKRDTKKYPRARRSSVANRSGTTDPPRDGSGDGTKAESKDGPAPPPPTNPPTPTKPLPELAHAAERNAGRKA